MADGSYLYAGWSHQWLLRAAQEFTQALGMGDAARVKLHEADSGTVAVD